MIWLVRVCTSLITVLTNIADAVNVVYADKTDDVEGKLLIEYIVAQNLGKKTTPLCRNSSDPVLFIEPSTYAASS